MDIDVVIDLSQHIRKVDGNNDVGAGRLAELICEEYSVTKRRGLSVEDFLRENPDPCYCLVKLRHDHGVEICKFTFENEFYIMEYHGDGSPNILPYEFIGEIRKIDLTFD